MGPPGSEMQARGSSTQQGTAWPGPCLFSFPTHLQQAWFVFLMLFGPHLRTCDFLFLMWNALPPHLFLRLGPYPSDLPEMAPLEAF